MFKNIFFKTILTVCCCVIMLFNGIGVFAANEAVKTGFIEYTVAETVDFYEIIEVQLINIETGQSYVHSLYRINDFSLNKEIVVGTYTVHTKVISETEEDVSQYRVVCLKDTITVTNSRVATEIPLRVDTYMSVEATPEVYLTPSDTEGYIEDDHASSTNENTSRVESEDNTKQETEQVKEKDSSLLKSTLFFLGTLLLMTIGYFYIRKRYLRK